VEAWNRTGSPLGLPGRARRRKYAYKIHKKTLESICAKNKCVPHVFLHLAVLVEGWNRTGSPKGLPESAHRGNCAHICAVRASLGVCVASARSSEKMKEAVPDHIDIVAKESVLLPRRRSRHS
jgi:hypothetical protein